MSRTNDLMTPVKTIYDEKADALYIRFSQTDVSESEEVAEGVVLDFDRQGKIVAIEVLDASKHLSSGVTFPSAAE